LVEGVSGEEARGAVRKCGGINPGEDVENLRYVKFWCKIIQVRVYRTCAYSIIEILQIGVMIS